MYNFIFWFFYKFFEWRDKYKSPFLAASMVGFVVVIHLSAVYAVFRYFSGSTISLFSDNYAYNRLMLLPIVILFFFIVYRLYYKKKVDEILAKFDERNPFSVKNIAIVVLLIIVPLLFAIKLTNLSVHPTV